MGQILRFAQDDNNLNPQLSNLPGDRMDEKGLFTKFWSNESKTTRKVLARIPEGSD